MNRRIISAERLRDVLDYDPDTGFFWWIRGKLNGRRAGCIKRNGYVYISIDNKGYLAHRLAWMYVRGEAPPTELDHVNRVKHDNRIANLRLATRAQNMQNAGARINSTSGVRGVYWDRQLGKWRATIKRDGRSAHLGCFSSIEEAESAYVQAARDIHGDFVCSAANDNDPIKAAS